MERAIRKKTHGLFCLPWFCPCSFESYWPPVMDVPFFYSSSSHNHTNKCLSLNNWFWFWWSCHMNERLEYCIKKKWKIESGLNFKCTPILQSFHKNYSDPSNKGHKSWHLTLSTPEMKLLNPPYHIISSLWNPIIFRFITGKISV